MGVLTGVEPERVFYYFEEISGIPRGSGNTKQISDYCAAFARSHGLEVLQDAVGNVVIRKGASPGKEGSAPVMLQGHLDMVTAKTPDCDIDMRTEGLRLKVGDGILSAEGTTLGGDDGIAVAYMLALLDAQDLAHPPLECVFTVDEEIGMLGAYALDMSALQAKRLINLDSEDEGILTVSCAGGVSVSSHLQVVMKPARNKGVKVRVHRCLGGHSGMGISVGRANAIRELGRFLFSLKKITPFRIVTVSGGAQDNAIPVSAEAVITFPDAESVEKVYAQAEYATGVLRSEYALIDPDIAVSCEIVDTDGEAFGTHTTNRVVTALRCMPNGMQRMSLKVDGLVETSLNLGTVEVSYGEVNLRFCVRSSVETGKTEVVERIRCLTEFLGGYISCEGDYPGMP